jgi:ABC-type transporter Mla subunit MlaD
VKDEAMPLQDLTPQLRTRLSRVERLVGWFIALATLLMLVGLAYYVYHTGQRKGWFVSKAPFFVYLRSGAGLKVGDVVKLMGFDAGEIIRITAAPPYTYDDEGKMLDVYVEFLVRDPYIGYVWSDSAVKVKAAGLLGARFLEVTKGGTSGSTNKTPATYKQDKTGQITEMLVDAKTSAYTNFTRGKLYWLPVDEPPELTAQMDEVIRTAKGALPGILDLTNRLSLILSNANSVAEHLDQLLIGSTPIVTNLNAATTNLNLLTAYLRETRGALGEWLLPTNIQDQLVLLLPNVNSTVTNVNTNLVVVMSNLNANLENLAGITSNLNAQVQANTNLVTSVNRAIIRADELMQGLKRHWLLRSAFKEKPTNQPPAKPVRLAPPRDVFGR